MALNPAHWRRLFRTLALVPLGCQQEIRIELLFETGDLLIVGRASAIETAARIIAIDDPKQVNDLSAIDADPEDVGVIRVPRALLRTPAGDSLDRETLFGVTLDRTGGCGRCQIPPHEGAQVVFPGDRCPPPPGSDVFVGESRADPDTSERLRARVTLAFPGDCRCNSLAPGTELTLRTLHPNEDRVPMSVTAPGTDGDVWLFGIGEAVQVLSSGERRSFSFAEPAAPYREILEAAAVLGDGIVVAGLISPPGQSTIPRVGLAWTSFELEARDRLGLDMDRASEIQVEGDAFMISGSVPGLGLSRDHAGLSSCDFAGGHMVCEELWPGDAYGHENARDIELLANGVLAVALDGALVAFFERWVRPEEVAGSSYDGPTSGSIRLFDGTSVRFRIFELGGVPLQDHAIMALGDRIVGIGRSHDLRSGITVSRVGSDLEPQPELTACMPGLFTGFSRPAADVVRAHFGTERAFDARLGATGSFPCPELEPAPWFDTRHTPLGIGRTLFTDERGNWYVSSSSSSRSIAYGAGEFERFGAALARERKLFALSMSAAVSFPDGERIALSFPSLPLAATWEPEGGRTLVAGHDWLTILHSDLSTLVTIPMPGTALVARALAPLTKDRFLVLNGQSLFMVDEGLVEIETLWDDPNSEEVEEKPPPCDDIYYAASSVGGVGWVVGCEGLLMRVLSRGGLVRAERVAFSGRYHTLFSQRELTAVEGICPDRALVATDAPAGASAWIWDVSGATLSSRLLPEGPPMAYHARAPMALWPTELGIVSFHGGEPSYWHRQDSAVRTSRGVFGDEFRSVATNDDRVLIVTRTGRVLSTRD
ncbi:MAG: hypothetical protein HYV07_24715 [Deltaproteobacteria bacterium]|nr:hypothetical protein [Deltaproteobacteria bacterium]